MSLLISSVLQPRPVGAPYTVHSGRFSGRIDIRCRYCPPYSYGSHFSFSGKNNYSLDLVAIDLPTSTQLPSIVVVI